MRVDRLFIYPIKSLAGIEVSHAHIAERGFRLDRRYMLVDEAGVFISQRECHFMALFHTSLENDGIRISYKNERKDLSLKVPFETRTGKTRMVTIWEDRCEAIELSDEANAYFSERLLRKCALVYMPDSTERFVDKGYATQNDITSFADAFPILMIGSASLADLNSRLPENEQCNWDRFRPNMVVQTNVPFEEDNWHFFQVGSALLHCVKPCARCVITTIDQQTAKAGKEPLRTLARFRTVNKKVMFGQNVVIASHNESIRIGDAVSLV